jgi:signal transduction histidine kinase
LNDGEESGSDPGETIAHPLLIACDSRGRVLWMSARTRAALGEAEKLVQVSPTELKAEGVPDWLPISTLRFWRVLEMGESVLIGAQASEPAASINLQEVSELLHLQANLIQHYFRLQLAERSLAEHAQKKRPGSGPKAVRLIEMERQRLGRDLHTGVGQTLAAIRLQVEVMSRQLPRPPVEVRQAMKHIDALANDALEQVRSISKRLHPPEWQRLKLEAALQQLWEISGVPQRFESSLRISPLPAEPDLDVKVLLYRAAQEALSNLARHSRATRVDAALELLGDSLVLSVHDNGVGFDVAGLLASPASVASGIGLRSIREMAAALGGELQIQSGPLGTKLVVSVSWHPTGV